MAPTLAAAEFQYRASRIASFTQGTKLGNTKSLKFWTNSALSPDHLADCGFHYTPTRTYPDQVTCFWCGKKERNLDNVDSVSEFHLKNWPKCPYSRIVCNLERFVKDSDKERFWLRLREQDAPKSVAEPHSTASILLRLATFKNLWKFDDKRRSKVKVTSRGLAEAGFYYSPVDKDDDRVICMYCDCPLSDWVIDDDPMVEHKKNSFVFCYFLHTLNGTEVFQIPRPVQKTGLPVAEAEENASLSEGDSQLKLVPDVDLNRKPVNDSDDINSSAQSLAELKHQTLLDVFDFSIEDLERNDHATIFNGHDILPRRFTRKRKQDLQDEHQKKRIALGKHSSTPDKSTSLALKVREEGDNEDPEVSIDEMVDYGHEEASDLSVIHSTLLSSALDLEVVDPEDGDYTESSIAGAELIESDKSSFVGSIPSQKQPPAQAKSKPKSQFSDDDFDLNSHDLEAILNSPKKGRKMKVLKQEDALILPSDIYNLSHQNLGDYDELNLAYLEGNSRRNIPNRIVSKGAPAPLRLAPLKAELKQTLKPTNLGNNTILNDLETSPVNQHHSSSKLIEVVQSSRQNSPTKSDETALGLAPQSLPKEASIFLERLVDSHRLREMVENNQQIETALSKGYENAESMLGSSKASKDEEEVENRVETASEADIVMLQMSSAHETLPNKGVSAENATTDLSETIKQSENTEKAITDGLESPIELKADKSEEIVQYSDEIESDNNDSVAINSLRPSSRGSDDKIKHFDVSPSSYEEYKKELQSMESELIETSIHALPGSLDADQDQIPDTGVDVSRDEDRTEKKTLEHELDDPLRESDPEIRNADNISRIEESASEDPQLLSMNTSLLEREKSMNTSRLDSVKETSTEFESEDAAGDEKPAKPAQESYENNTKSSPPLATETVEQHEKEEEKESQSSPYTSPAGFTAKFVERVKAMSPSQIDTLPKMPNKAEGPQNLQEKEMEDKPLEAYLLLGLDASTPEKKNNLESKRTVPKVSLNSALQKLKVLEETIEYLVEVSTTDQELHNDMEGVVTEFIAAMPEEEESMSISEWIVHNASTCRRTIEEAAQDIIEAYVEEFDKVIAHVERLDTID